MKLTTQLLAVMLTLIASSCAAPAGSIGAMGGSVTSSDGARVTIPAGAIEGSIPVTAVSTTGVEAPSSTTIVGVPVTLGPEGQLFAAPVTVTLPISAALLPAIASAASVVIYTAPAGTTSYTALKTTVVDAGHVSALVTHFSIFVAAVASPCASKADCYKGESCVNGVCIGSGGCAITENGQLQFCYAWSTLPEAAVESLCPTGSSSPLTGYTLVTSCPTANLVGTCAFTRSGGVSYSELYYSAAGFTCADAETSCAAADSSGVTTVFTGQGC